MSDFLVDATARTPKIELKSEAGTLLLAGESYPEDVTLFYGQLNSKLSEYINTAPPSLTVSIKLTYFNSSSARALMELMDRLDEAARSGTNVAIDWYCDPDDDITQEFAEDIGADITDAKLTLHDLDKDDG